MGITKKIMSHARRQKKYIYIYKTYIDIVPAANLFIFCNYRIFCLRHVSIKKKEKDYIAAIEKKPNSDLVTRCNFIHLVKKKFFFCFLSDISNVSLLI